MERKRRRRAESRSAASATNGSSPGVTEVSPGLEMCVGTGRAGDHTAVHTFLNQVFHGPPRDIFLSSLDDPFYEPHDRLVVRSGWRILAHVHVTKRVMCLGTVQIPVAGLHRLGTLPEFRGQKLGGQLLRAAEGRMRADNAAVGLLRTRIPYFFRREGWALCGRHSRSSAPTRDLLSRILATHPPRELALNVRPWRQIELPALMRLYGRWTARSSGPIERTEAYWRWLVSGQGCDQIFVAVDGPDRPEIDETSPPVIGYAVVKDDRVLELCVDDSHPTAAAELLARVCRDAIERGSPEIVLDAGPDDPWHAVFQSAGGRFQHDEFLDGEVFMAKLLDADNLLARLCPELHRRALETDIARPSELGLLVGDRKLCVIVGRRGVRIGRGRLGRSYLSLNDADFTRLLLGHTDWDQASAAGRIESSTRTAWETARRLFPRLPYWRPPFDDLLV